MDNSLNMYLSWYNPAMAKMKKQAIWAISAAALIAAAGGGWFAYDHTKKTKAFQETMDSLVLE